MIQNLSKIVLEAGGTVAPLLIPSDQTGGTGLTNPSILIQDGKILVNLRHVGYTLWHAEGEQKFHNSWSGPLQYLNPENDLTLRTINFLCEIDPVTLQVKNYERIDTSKLDVKPLWEFIGLEDGRLVNWDDTLYLIGVRRDTTTNGVGRMEFSAIKEGREVSRNRIEPPGGPNSSYCEKNWMPIPDMPYHFVKWTNPTEVVKVDLETNTSQTVKLTNYIPGFPRDLRGGSQVLKWGEYRIALTHEVDLWKTEIGAKDGQYYHRFIVWDKDWNIVKKSSELKFMDSNIEFSCGMAFEQENLLITFGHQDNSSYIMRMPLTVLNNLLDIK